MTQRFHAFLIIIAVMTSLAFLPAVVQAEVVINPLAWGLNPGDTFRLVVVTAGNTTGTSTSIAAYDTFVNAQGLSGITYSGSSLSWQAIARTPASSPISDGSRYSSQANATRTYNLNGALVSTSTNGQAFWKTAGFNQHLAAIDWTIDGSGNLSQVNGSQLVWTGFDIDGTAASATDFDENGSPVGTVTAALGQTAAYNGWDFGTNQQVPATLYPYLGRAGALANGWSAFDNQPLTSAYRMYAMSDLITVTAVPEPATLSQVTVLTICAGSVAWRRRRGRSSRMPWPFGVAPVGAP